MAFSHPRARERPLWKRYTGKWSSSENEVDWRDQPYLPFSPGTMRFFKSQETTGGEMGAVIFLLKIDEKTSSKAIRPSPGAASFFSKFHFQSVIFRMRLTCLDQIWRKMFGWMCHSPPWVRSVCSGWGVMGDAGTFYISISTHYQPASAAGKRVQIPRKLVPFCYASP